ncbi:MAG TPA: CoB--CoM heterodisulfide reductase iron-sulfur subunit A family protein [Planctomycetaceae bacterium]|nr:CoB--CoM heterodisulfide reductase iron-sulfur subunit A family protein [Planctomycetaceae bacterium]HIQ21218.1 CoB--CoM heterodisulfide reductase iron-sulfur subunit A family protein [Planctomycetota bacterium]
MSGNGRQRTILVAGGGISGISAAIEASEAGCQVVLVEKEPYLGGRVVQMHQYFPKLCPPTCGLEINFRRLRTSPRIRCLTLAEVETIGGGPGHYQVTIRRRPRMVNRKCTACGACVEACPVERPDAFNYGMGTTRAIYLPHPMAFPLQYVIDTDACPGAECGKCVAACPYQAIDLEMQSETIQLEVQAVIWATGWEPYDASKIEGLGFGTYPNVITNVMMERLASSNGPTAGKIQRPSDGQPIQSVAFVQCAGSRDENYLKHCSGVCCMASLKQARYVREQYPDAEISIFYIDIRTPGRLEDFYSEIQKDGKVQLIKGKVAKISEDGGDLVVEAEDTLSGERVTRKVNLVVLATGIVPQGAEVRFETGGGLARDEHGFLTEEQGLSGMLPVGCAKRPSEVAGCVRDATGAALKALHICAGSGCE